jgi:hypothetical protein
MAQELVRGATKEPGEDAVEKWARAGRARKEGFGPVFATNVAYVRSSTA